ncbi:hypothetical protein OKA04_03305 [Luteolibacter flavescens]|uniref:LamG-like jellyroll fold domain-containing protein n=1 Tax=Luteolibacter flavescens TaxID=1859460 RepID=A0ABT3FJJ1_9BACT|nr:LamG-like jellyroll fold domain-containing protein [Luteolibacter flavescens]MCW1883740.1 hypothetical protein [Luteolibacter flavescens]
MAFQPFLRRLCATLLLLILGSSLAGASIQEVRGLYSFSGNLNSRWNFQSPLAAGNFTPVYGTETMPTGGASLKLELPALTSNQSLQLRNWAASNNGAGINGGGAATRTNRWTLVMDIKPTLGATWTSILQTDVGNTTDAEIFLNSSGRVFIRGYVGAAGTIVPNQWQRLAFVCNNDGAGGPLSITAYVNGTLLGTSTTTTPLDGDFSLGPAAHLFTDDNNETSPNQINTLGFWTHPLSAAEIAAMGGAQGTAPEIQWPSMPSATAMPGLTGKLNFGSFQLVLPNSGFQMGSGTVAFNGANAYVAAFPNYFLSGTRAVRLAANGDLIYTGPDTTLSFTGGGSVRLNNVLMNPGTITLSTTGAIASNYQCTLPIGMGVTTSPKGRKLAQIANNGPRGLTSGFTPTGGAITLSSSSFGFTGGQTLYLSVENFPVRYTVPSITWAPSSGAFQVPASSTPAFDRQYERICLEEWNAISGVQGDPRPSNDDSFAFVTNTSLMVFDTNASGLPRLREGTFNFTTGSSTGFESHFPRGARLRWSLGGSSMLRYVAGAIDGSVSHLFEGTTASLSVRRDSPESGCGILAGNRTFSFTPPDHWKFTRDGGLHAQVTVGNSIEWGAIDASTFAHRTNSGFATGGFLMAGNCLRSENSTGINIIHRPAALLLSGNGNGTVPDTVVERPGTAAYYTGAADYPGLNLRAPSNGSMTATSRLAGTPLTYSLRGASKFNLRPAGVTGVLDAVTQTPGPGQSYPISTVLAGYAVGLSDIRLSFLDGANVGSGVNGAFNLPAPAMLTNLAVERLRFGQRGELLDATFPNSNEMTLGYWGCKLTPRAIHFALPDTACPSPSQSTLILGSEVKLPALSDQAFHGNIGVKANGHTVTPNDNLVLNNGEKVTSRLRPPSQLKLKGPGTTTYPFTPCSTGAYLNEYSNVVPQGFVVLPGEIDVPFFRSLRTVIHAKSSAGATTASSLRIFAGDTPTFNFFGAAEPDGGNLGHPIGTNPDGVPLPAPNARRELWDLIKFDLPVEWNDLTRRFVGEPKQDDLVLFKLDQRCTSLGPKVAEINFGASIDPDAISISTAKLFDSLGADSSGLLGQIVSNLNDAGGSGSAFSSALDKLLSAEKLNDDLLAILVPGLESALDTPADALYKALAKRYEDFGSATYRSGGQEVDTIFNNAIAGTRGQISALPDAEWGQSIRASLEDAIGVCDQLLVLTDNADRVLAISMAIASLDEPIAPPPGFVQTLQDLKSSVTELRKTLANIQDTFDGGSSIDLLNSTISNDGTVELWLQQAIKQLKDDWVSRIDDPMGADFFKPDARRQEFIAAFKKAVSAGFLGSSTAHRLRSAISATTDDALYQLRGSFDGVISTANLAAQSVFPLPDTTVQTLGAISEVFQGASMTGYARINGDSLQEIRLDGNLKLKMPDDMTIQAWFHLRDVDGSMPGDGTLSPGTVKTVVEVGASAPLDFLGQKAQATAEMRVGIGANGPVMVSGCIGTKGNLDFQSIRVKEAQFGVGIGALDAYVFAKAAGELNAAAFAMSAEAALFFGKTSTIQPIQKVNPNIAALLTALDVTTPETGGPLYGAYMFAYGDFSVLSLLGIPPSCLLDLRVGGGQGYYGFYRPGASTLAGMQFAYGVRGQVLCLLDISGRLDGYIAGAVANEDISFNSMKAAGRMIATLSGEIGISPFSYDWKKNFSVDVIFNAAADPKTSWSIHY